METTSKNLGRATPTSAFKYYDKFVSKEFTNVEVVQNPPSEKKMSLEQFEKASHEQLVAFFQQNMVLSTDTESASERATQAAGAGGSGGGAVTHTISYHEKGGVVGSVESPKAAAQPSKPKSAEKTKSVEFGAGAAEPSSAKHCKEESPSEEIIIKIKEALACSESQDRELGLRMALIKANLAIRDDSDSGQLHYLAGWILYRLKQPDEAIQHLKAAVQNGYIKAQEMLDYALKKSGLDESEKVQRLIKCAEETSEIDPDRLLDEIKAISRQCETNPYYLKISGNVQSFAKKLEQYVKTDSSIEPILPILLKLIKLDSSLVVFLDFCILPLKSDQLKPYFREIETSLLELKKPSTAQPSYRQVTNMLGNLYKKFDMPAEALNMFHEFLQGELPQDERCEALFQAAQCEQALYSKSNDTRHQQNSIVLLLEALPKTEEANRSKTLFSLGGSYLGLNKLIEARFYFNLVSHLDNDPFLQRQATEFIRIIDSQMPPK